MRTEYIIGLVALTFLLSRGQRGKAPPASVKPSNPSKEDGMPPLPLDVFDCRPSDFPQSVPPLVQEGYLALRPYVDLIERLVGNVEISSWWRPPVCNERVGGAEASRHKEGWAVDMRLNGSQSQRLRSQIAAMGNKAQTWGDFVRSEIGTSRKVGFRMYPSGNIHIDLGCPQDSLLCSPRRQDWLEIL